MADLGIGDIREGKGGKQYVYTGGDPKDRNSWAVHTPTQPFVPSSQKSNLPSVGDVGEAVVKTANMLKPPGGHVVDWASDQFTKGAYELGGLATDYATSKGATPETAAKIGYGTNVGVQALPVIMSGPVMNSILGGPSQNAGRWFMQKAVKPSRDANLSGDAAKAIETMLKEGVNVTPSGIKKLSTEVGQLAGKVDDAVNAAQASGATVNKYSILGPWADKLDDLSKQINNKKDVDAATKVLGEFMKDARVAGVTDIPVKTAQDMKTATYKALSGKYTGELESANIEAQKAIVRGLKDGIEKAAPGVAAPNRRMSELLNAIEVVEPRALMAGNQNFGGLSYLAENPFAAGGFMLDRSSGMNSILGRGFYTGVPSVLRYGGPFVGGSYGLATGTE